MTTLASAVSIGDNQLLIDTPLAAGQVPGWVKIDSELLKVGGQHFRTGIILVLSEPAAAAHNNGATVTYAGNPYDAAFLSATSGAGAAGVTVDNTVDPPFTATTLISSGATESAPDEATFPLKVIYAEDDPGAVGAGTIWIRQDIVAGVDVLFVRDSDDLQWSAVQLGTYSAGVLQTLVNPQYPGMWVFVGGVERASVVLDVNSVLLSADDLGGNTATVGVDAGLAWIEGITAAGTFSVVAGNGNIVMFGLPTADPSIAGALWIDTAAGRVIKSSAG